MPSDNDQQIKTAIFAIFSILAIFLAVSCKECPTEPDYDIYLSVEDVFCTSVTLGVTLPDSGSINTFTLDRNDSTVAIYTCLDDDTLITDENLMPDTDYSYRVRFLKDGKTRAESGPISVHTLPTTSHDFTWEIDTLGNYGSYLNDVWIVDEDEIWVVGNIVMPDPDSSWNGTGRETFNAAHWDGVKWELIRAWGPVPLQGIWYFDVNNIWVSGGFPIHWDGEKWNLYHLQDMGLGQYVSVDHIWASSPHDIYFVGRKGSIVHYDGSTFRKMESGTDINLTDVYGLDDKILICGYNRTDGRCILLSGNQSGFEKLYESDDYDYTGRVELSSVFQSLWIYNNQLYIATSAGFWQQHISGNRGYLRLWTEIIENRIWPNCIRGTAPNDIFIVSDKGDVIHYNGETFENYIGSQGIQYGPPQLYSVACGENMVAACGVLNSTFQALVYRGRR